MSVIVALSTVDDHGHIYSALQVWCPGCDHLKMLPVSGDVPPGTPQWSFDGNLEAPTIAPSILTRGADFVCHSFLRCGVWEFLSDSTHALAGQQASSPPLPAWVTDRTGS